MKQASDDHWIQACAVAWKRLCRGEDEWFVLNGESWAQAIARVAARILYREGYGRPMGPVRQAWVRIAEAFAARTPCSLDGLVQGPSRLRVSIKTCNERFANRVGHA